MPSTPSSTAAPVVHAARRRVFILAAILLAAHFVLAVGSKLHESTTSDELAHLTGGLNYWENDDYRLHPENGILPMRWAALPAWAMGTRFPELKDNPYWGESDVWVVGHQVFYETGDDHFPRLMAGRAMIALFSVATGLLVFLWSRRLFGDAAGLVSLAFFAFSPTFLAHGALVTSDVCMAFFFLAAAGAWWRHLHDGRPSAWWLSAAALALAFVAKQSAPLLLPMIVAMAAIRAFAPAPLERFGRTFSSRAGKFGAAVLSGVGHGLVVWAVIWAFYGFRYSAFAPHLPAGVFVRPWSYFEPNLSRVGRLLAWTRDWKLLPESYLYGYIYVYRTVEARSAFLNGEYSMTGWPSFFLWAFVLKTTVPVLIATFLTASLAVLQGVRQRAAEIGRALYPLTPLLILFAVYWASSLRIHLNIGQRHILPTYPVLFILIGALGAALLAARWPARVLLAALLGWQVTAAASIAPNFIAYFNPIAGGPENGRHHLVDSSIDWGQDLPALKDWLAQHVHGEPVYLSYFGSGEPGYYHLPVRRLTFLNNFKMPPRYEPLEPGYYCVSATIVSQVYTETPGRWTAKEERDFEVLRALEQDYADYTRDPPAWRRAHPAADDDALPTMIRRYDLLRLNRLCEYLQVRKPDAQIGYSILVYRLDAREIAQATAGSAKDWAALIEQTSHSR